MIKKMFFIFTVLFASLQAEMFELCDNRLDPAFIQKIINTFQVEIIVETDIAAVDTDALYFKKIFLVEQNGDLFLQAKSRFANAKNVRVYEGDVSDVLPFLLPAIQEKILFSLGAASDPKVFAAISASGARGSIFVFDNLRLCPSVPTLYEAITSQFPDYQFCVLGDMAIAFPKEQGVSASSLVTACTMSRLYTLCTKEQLLQAESVIKNSFNLPEGKVIETLHNKYIAKGKLNQYPHLALWKMLFLSGKNTNTGLVAFNKTDLTYQAILMRVRQLENAGVPVHTILPSIQRPN